MKVAFVGHSHINCIHRASQTIGQNLSVHVECIQLRSSVFAINPNVNSARIEDCNLYAIEQAVASSSKTASITVLCPTGNQHNIASLVCAPNTANENRIYERISRGMENYTSWLKALGRYACSPVAVLLPPPPIESTAHLTRNPGRFAELISRYGVTPSPVRLRAWLVQIRLIQESAAHLGFRCLDFPSEIFSESGFLNEIFIDKNPTHGNLKYGETMLRHVINDALRLPLATTAPGPTRGTKEVFPDLPKRGKHPYEGLADRAFWKEAVARVSMQDVDPVSEVPFKIGSSDQVATAGSCFAQHVSKRIRSAGLKFMLAEHSDRGVLRDGAEREPYDFSARYGNIYTARQLLQLFDRAFGHFFPAETIWTLPTGRFCDPFRPRIEPNGFASIAMLEEDRSRHLTAVREMFLGLDIFVFTLGLTECWASRVDGAVYPIAPGVAGGCFEPSQYKFLNFDIGETVLDLETFVRKLRAVNAKAKIILTVSPVPLVATYEPRHVIVSNTYSKATLRVAAESVSRSCDDVYYFPSFEIITGNYNRGRYFHDDLRSVTEEGIDHVMASFMRHFVQNEELGEGSQEKSRESDDYWDEVMKAADAACDEELVERK